jgi:acyl carrier protein
MTITDRVRQVLSLTLNTPIPAGEDFTRDGASVWDSLKHVELIFALEDEFDVQFSESMMQELVSLNAIVAVIRRLSDEEKPDAA